MGGKGGNGNRQKGSGNKSRDLWNKKFGGGEKTQNDSPLAKGGGMHMGRKSSGMLKEEGCYEK